MFTKPVFNAGEPLLQQVTAEKLNTLADLAMRGVSSVGGNLRMVAGPEGVGLFVPWQPAAPNRCHVLTGTTAVAIGGGGANANLSAITYDVTTDASGSYLGTLSGSVFTFVAEGYFLLRYTSAVELNIGGASTYAPTPVSASVTLLLGGTALATSVSSCASAKLPCFNGFLSTGGVALEATIDPTGWTSTSEGLTDNDGSVQYQATIASTIDGSQVTDLTTNASAVTGHVPAGVVAHTVCGQALIRVIRNTSGVVKILDGATERSPTVALFGVATGGTGNILNSTLSLLQL